MPAIASPLDILAEELGAVAGRIERDATLRIDAAIAELRRADAERDLRLERLERAMSDRLAALKDGEPGKSLTIDDVMPVLEDAVAKAVDALPKPASGKSVTIDDIRPLLQEMVSSLPKAENGRDADPESTRAMVGVAVAKAVEALPKPEPGKSVTVDEVRPIIEAEVARAVGELPAPQVPVNVADGLIDRDGNLVIAFSNGQTKSLGRVVGSDGRDVDMAAILKTIQEEVAAIPRPRDGADGVGFDDLEVIHDGARKFILRFVKGDRVKDFEFSIPVVLDKGVFRDGEQYYLGDGVSFGGSYWIARTDTKDKPGTSDAWRLSVKKGRDGKDQK